MNICVCGWYGRQFDDFYMLLYKVNRKHPVTVIAKKDDSFWDDMALSYALIDNVGLEWAAYDYYLQNVWRGGDTLFTHDDISIMPIIRDLQTVPPESLFDKLAETEADQAYLFGSRAEDVYGEGKHGRAFFVSHRLLEWWLKPHGIWFDKNNRGDTNNGNYNAGTHNFHELMKKAKQEGFDTCKKIYVPAYRMAHRGEFKNWEELL